jgi:hypothetical protein
MCGKRAGLQTSQPVHQYTGTPLNISDRNGGGLAAISQRHLELARVLALRHGGVRSRREAVFGA